jgi:hypothetical protein
MTEFLSVPMRTYGVPMCTYVYLCVPMRTYGRPCGRPWNPRVDPEILDGRPAGRLSGISGVDRAADPGIPGLTLKS